MNIEHLSIKLQDACFDADMGLVKDCIKLGADINGRVNPARYSPLFLAVGSMDYDIIRYLLEQGTDANHGGSALWSPPHEAIDIEADSTHYGLASIELLVEYGADVNALEKSGRSPLEITRNYHSKAEDLLRRLGSRPSTFGI